MPRTLVPTTVLGALLAAACGSSVDGAGTDESAGADATCESFAVGEQDYLRIEFSGTGDVMQNYFIRLAEPDGSRETFYEIRGIEPGATVRYETPAADVPADCAVTEVAPSPTDTEDFPHVDGCAVALVSEASVERIDVTVDLTNRGDDAATYSGTVSVTDPDGTIVTQAGFGRTDLLEPGASVQETRSERLSGAIEGLTCEVAFVSRTA